MPDMTIHLRCPLALVLSLVSACVAENPARRGLVVRDSAGVRIVENAARGTPRKVVFVSGTGRTETVIGNSGFATRVDTFRGDELVRSVDLPVPFTKFAAEKREGGGWAVEATLGRNAQREHPAFFELEVEADGEGRLESVTGTMFQCKIHTPH